jgi:hypothetical protein
VPEEILYDRMKTAVIGEDDAGVVTYNAALVALLNHYGAVPRACQPYRAKTKGKVERPFRYIRQDFFLARTFRNIDDLNARFEAWRTEVPNPRVHATTRRVVDAAFAEEQPRCLIPWFDGVILSQDWKEALWDKFVTAAPRPRTPSELQYSDRKLRSRN